MQEESVDSASLQELRNIMGDEFCLLVDVFIRDSVQRLQDLQQAIDNDNAAEVRTVAHGFKGSALNLSAHRLTEYCRQLESMGRDAQLEGAAEILAQVKQEFERVRVSLLA